MFDFIKAKKVMWLNPERYKNRYRISSARLKGCDYKAVGYYFVTICTQQRIPYFGEIIKGKLHLSRLGEIAQKYWLGIPVHFTHAALDEFVIMPNHVHGILVILPHDVETQHAASLQDAVSLQNQLPKPGSISTIVRSYKSSVKQWTTINGYSDFGWQARFYDHIIRNEKSLDNIRLYIQSNPTQWENDEYHT
jgi:REP element-mobilizing transposase RayT